MGPLLTKRIKNWDFFVTKFDRFWGGLRPDALLVLFPEPALVKGCRQEVCQVEGSFEIYNGLFGLEVYKGQV